MERARDNKLAAEFLGVLDSESLRLYFPGGVTARQRVTLSNEINLRKIYR